MPSGLSKRARCSGHDIIFPLSLAELHNRNLLLYGKSLHACHEAPGHGIHQRRRGKGMTAMAPEELHDSGFALQRRHVHIEVHPVDALQFERHVLVQDFGYALWYAHFRLRYDSGSSGPTATSVAISLARTAFSSSPSTGAISPDYQLLLKRTRYISSV